MATNSNVFSGEFFIVPNSKVSRESVWRKSQFDEIMKAYGFDPMKEGESLVEVWSTDVDCYDENGDLKPGKCDNWADHWKFGRDSGIIYPASIPMSIIKDLKEGQTVRFKVYGMDIEMKANQLGHRYRRFGKFDRDLKFEEVLKIV